MRMSGRTLAVLLPLAVGALAVPSIAVADALSGGSVFRACADAEGYVFSTSVDADPECELLEQYLNTPVEGETFPTVDLHEVQWNQAGQQGPAGTNLSGYKQIKKSFTVAAKKSASLYAGCPAGQVPVNGGADGSTSVDTRMSFPTAGGWKVRVVNESSSSKAVSVWVTCANAPVAAS